MVKHFGVVRRVRGIQVTAVALLAITVAAIAAPRLPAAELADQAHSLRVVPADAAFYSASLRLKEQLDIFLESKTYQRLMEIPVIQLGKMQLMFQWQQNAMPQVAEVREYLQSAEGQDAIALLSDMFSTEAFMYGSSDVAGVLELFMEFNSIGRQARIDAIASGDDVEGVIEQRTKEVLAEQVGKLKIPTLVFGWRIEDGERAKRQLDAVHSLVRNLLDEHRQELSAHLQRDQIGGNEFLTLRVDGSMIPWDELREDAEDDEEFEKWKSLISEKSAAVALGIIDEFVLLAIGESTDHLESFGKGDSVSGQGAIARLNKHADERVASIGYMSKELAETLSSPERTIDDLVGMADEALHAAEIDEEQLNQLLTDLRGLGDDMKKYLPGPGDVAGVSFLTGRGYEGYRYQTAAQPMWDSSQKLTLLDHLGGNPLVFIATRSKEDPEDYAQAVEWVKRIGVQVEKIAEAKAPPEDWGRYQEYRDEGVELLNRLDQANREHFMPALADGQMALVLDTAANSTRWHAEMPESPKPLPMLELAVVCSVSDAEHLRQGIKELFDVAQDGIALARKIDPDAMPEFDLPKPTERSLEDGGTLHVYSLPSEWGLDSQVAISAGLTDTVAAASWSPGTTERLLAETPLDIDTSLELDRPAAVVSHFQYAKFITSVRPWIDYGFDVATGKLKVEAEDEDEDEDEEEEDSEGDEEANAQQAAMVMQMGFVMPQIQQFLEVTTAFQSVSSVTYEDDGVWVTHSEVYLKDLK